MVTKEQGINLGIKWVRVRNANFLKCQQSYRSRRLAVFLHWFVIIADLWRANNKLEKTFLQPATAFENELEGPFADPAGWYMRCNKTILPFSLVVHSWAHSQRASFAKLCCVRRDGIIVLAYTTPVDSQQKMVPIFSEKRRKTRSRNPEQCWELNTRYYPEFE